MRFHKRCLAVVGILFCFLLTAAPSAVRATSDAPEAHTEIVILHTNDLHFDFNHREDFEEVVAHFRENYPNVLLLDAGDIFVRHRHRWPTDDLEFYRERSRFMIETMNQVGYDAATLGNHEIAYHGTITRDSLRLAEFPLLGANVEVSTDKLDPPEPYTIMETAEGWTVAVLGLTGGGYGQREGIGLTSPAQAVEDHLHLAEEHNLFVLLTHVGLGADLLLAARFGEVDVIVGGHSHSHIDPARNVNGVLIAQTGGNPHAIDPDRRQLLGVVRVVLDEEGGVVAKSGKLLAIDGSSEVIEALTGAEPQAERRQDAGQPAEAVGAGAD